MPVPWQFYNLTTAKTQILAPGPCELIAVTVNTASAGTTLTVFDGSSTTTTTGMRKVATIDTGTLNTYVYGCLLDSGLVVTSSGTADVTVIFALYRTWDEFNSVYPPSVQPGA